MNENIGTVLRELATPLAASLGLGVWGVEVAPGKRSVVRLFVESESGVDIDKCAELSRLLGLTLEVEDIIQGAYVLEVSSPGLERTFFTPGQMAAYAGKTVEVSLHAPTREYPDKKKLLGTLTVAEGGEFSLLPLDAPKDAAVPAILSWSDVKKARLVHFLPEAPNALKGRKPKQPKTTGTETIREGNGEIDTDATS